MWGGLSYLANRPLQIKFRDLTGGRNGLVRAASGGVSDTQLMVTFAVFLRHNSERKFECHDQYATPPPNPLHAAEHATE